MKKPLYMYVWNERSAATYLVYSEEDKDRIQRQMLEDGAKNEYTWYSLTELELD